MRTAGDREHVGGLSIYFPYYNKSAFSQKWLDTFRHLGILTQYRRFIDRVGKLRFAVPAALVMFIGLIGMYFVRGSVAVMAAGTVMMSGHMMLSAALSANIRDWTPEGKVGHFQGIRMIFAVMLPMVIGPAIGAAVIRGGQSTYLALGQVKTVPTPAIYLAAAIVLLLVAVPLAALKKRERSKKEETV